ncbi:MAG: hypothetical protein ACYTEQ_28865 [Planctomycetota bacterium]|jgi:hypothetical protein
MIQDKPGLTVQSLEMNLKNSLLTLSERQTPLLISFGLVQGTTLLFGARLLSRNIPAGVLYAPDGKSVEQLKMDF